MKDSAGWAEYSSSMRELSDQLRDKTIEAAIAEDKLRLTRRQLENTVAELDCASEELTAYKEVGERRRLLVMVYELR